MPLISLLVAASMLAPQDIPPGVRYKRASDEVNKAALTKLEKFYNTKFEAIDLTNLAGKVVVVGPGLWNAMKQNTPAEFKSATKATFVIPNESGNQELEGRVAKTADAKDVLLLAVKVLARDKRPTIRKAKADELRYYWAIIPYDIEEPLYIADFGKSKFLFDFEVSGKEPRIFHVDIVLPMNG